MPAAEEADERRVTPARIQDLREGEIFVFGSNAAGRHAGGAARTARKKFGAVNGQGHGRQGRSYAIDSMSGLDTLAAEAATFLDYARAHPELVFLLTPVGCGIAGHAPSEVAPLFASAPDNVALPREFLDVLDDHAGDPWMAG